MTEKSIKINTPDNHVIYGTLNLSDKKSDKLIIFVHGFTGHSNEHIFYNAARFFPQNGFDTFRFNFYWYEPGARKLTETTIDKHVEDLNTVLREFRESYETIYLVGHSLASVVLLADVEASKVARIVLWEPAREPKGIVRDLEETKSADVADVYVEESNVNILIGKKFVESLNRLPPVKSLIERCSRPVKIISAENGGGEKVGKNLYYANAKEPKAFYLVKEAGHTFDEKDTEKELFEETLKWIKE